MGSAVSGFGSKLNWNAVDLAEVKNISGPSQSMDTIDVTSHDSPNMFREFVAGLRNGGEITIEGNFIKTDSTGQIAMHTDFQAGLVRAWIIKMPGWSDGKPQIAGTGYITAFEVSYPIAEEIAFSATIKVTGKPTLTVV